MVDLPPGVVPMQVVTETPIVFLQHVAPKPHPLNDSGFDRADVHVHAVGTETPKRAHGNMLSLEIDDCVSFGGIQIRIEAGAGNQQQLALVIMTDDPKALVDSWVC